METYQSGLGVASAVISSHKQQIAVQGFAITSCQMIFRKALWDGKSVFLPQFFS